MRLGVRSAWIAALTAACGPYPGVEVIGATDEQAEIVDRVMATWEDAAKHRPRLRSIRFVDRTEDLDLDPWAPAVYRCCDRIFIVTPDAEGDVVGERLVESLHHELGHAFDYSHVGKFSSDSYWDPYYLEDDPADQPHERYAETAGFGPDGLRLFPDPGEADCPLNQSVDDAAVVREDLLRPDRLDLRSPAPVTRTILLPRGASVSSLYALGEDGVGFNLWAEKADMADLLMPDLDLPEMSTSLDRERWPDLEYDPQAQLWPEEAPPTWAPGIGQALENPTPIGDGSTQISRVHMDKTRASMTKVDLWLYVETDLLTGEVLAVQDTWCADPYRVDTNRAPMVLQTSEGVWLLHFRGEQITMRFFPADGTPKAPERWLVTANPTALVREQ